MPDVWEYVAPFDIEGVSCNPVSDNPDTGKLKIFSMGDTLYDIYQSDFLMDVQYRGFNGNPDHAIAFKILFGVDDDAYELEPDRQTRIDSVRCLVPSNTYFWQATWGNFFRLKVFAGGSNGVNGSGSGVGGASIYDLGYNIAHSYQPDPHYLYLGVNNSSSETGSWPGAIYRNVWIANKPRPSSLGSALASLPSAVR